MPDQNALFAHALGLTPPWKVTEVIFSEQKGCLDIHVDFERGASFNCPVCGKPGAKAYDTEKQVWRHLDFFQYQAFIIARVPRVKCKHGCGIRKVEVPWARQDRGFTLLFEAYFLRLAKDMPVAAIARLLNEHDTRLWRVVKHYVVAGRARADFSGVTRIGIDETSARKGHDYITYLIAGD
ncbi:MAG: transposase family protein, partial [Moorella sp. (in: Bacteria)]|nr:transposase family protein [Moorella sp. (in: firmicutes)]